MSAADIGRLMGPVARRLLGEPNPELSEEAKGKLRYGTHGSLSIDLKSGVWRDHEADEGGGVLDIIHRQLGLTNSAAAVWLREEGFTIPNQRLSFEERIVCAYRYEAADGLHAFDVVRLRNPKDFRQRAPNGTWRVKGIPKVLYRLPQLIAADPAAPVFIARGKRTPTGW